jgi:hypothetical protein
MGQSCHSRKFQEFDLMRLGCNSEMEGSKASWKAMIQEWLASVQIIVFSEKAVWTDPMGYQLGRGTRGVFGLDH